MSQNDKYSYSFDPEGDSTPALVVRLVGKNRRVLELGTAGGPITKVLKERNGCTITGVELDPELATQAEPWTARMIVGDLDRLDLSQMLEGERFDVIVVADILEHLRDPWRSLRQLQTLIADDGHLVASLPNVAHAGVIAALLQGHFPYTEKGLLDRTHLRFFSRGDLPSTFMEAGFFITEIHPIQVAPEATEHAIRWHKLDDRARRVLAEAEEADVYQYVIKARAMREAAWSEHLQERLAELEREAGHWRTHYEEAERQRNEYAKAFQEARELITGAEAERDHAFELAARITRERDEARTALSEQRAVVAEQAQRLEMLQRQLLDAQRDRDTAPSERPSGRLFRRLSRYLTRDEDGGGG